MNKAFPASVLAVDRKKARWSSRASGAAHRAYKIIRGCRFYLEDKPHYLDSPGEFWFDKKGNGGRLYIRLPGDQDPNMARVEVAKRIHMIESSGMSHVHIRGLTFRFTNVYWNLTAAPYWVSHESIDVEPGCVRLLGSGTDIEVTQLRLRARPQGRAPQGRGPARHHRPSDGERQRVLQYRLRSRGTRGQLDLRRRGAADGPALRRARDAEQVRSHWPSP